MNATGLREGLKPMLIGMPVPAQDWYQAFRLKAYVTATAHKGDEVGRGVHIQPTFAAPEAEGVLFGPVIAAE